MTKKLLALAMAMLMLLGLFAVGTSATTHEQAIAAFEHVVGTYGRIQYIQGVEVQLNGLWLSSNVNAYHPRALAGLSQSELRYLLYGGGVTYANASEWLIPEAVVLARNAANFNLLRLAVANSEQSVEDRAAALAQLNALWDRTVADWGRFWIMPSEYLGETISFAQAADEMRAAVLEAQELLGNVGVTAPFQFNMPRQQSSNLTWLWVLIGVLVAVVAAAAAAWFFLM